MLNYLLGDVVILYWTNFIYEPNKGWLFNLLIMTVANTS